VIANLDLGFRGAQNARLAGLGVVAHTEGLRDPAGAFTYTRIDAYARLRLAPHALLSLRGNNLGNERYAVIAGYPLPGRAFFLDLSTR